MIKFIKTLRTPCINYLKKAFKILSLIMHKYKKIKTDLMWHFKHLKKPVELFYELTRTLYNKKLRGKYERKQKRIGALKDILTEKMTNSLQYFTLRNIAL